jgi:hypothetical protein
MMPPNWAKTSLTLAGTWLLFLRSKDRLTPGRGGIFDDLAGGLNGMFELVTAHQII